jgi:transcription initiation factor TFIID subunit 6
MVPPVLTCLIGRRLGPDNGTLDHFELRDLAASLLKHLCDRYQSSAHSLRPRLCRSCLKTFLEPKKPFGSHYGAVLGLRACGGPEIIRKLLVPALKSYEEVVKEGLEQDGIEKAEAEKVVGAIMMCLNMLVEHGGVLMNGHGEQVMENFKVQLIEKVGEVFGQRIVDTGKPALARAILDETFDF